MGKAVAPFLKNSCPKAFLVFAGGKKKDRMGYGASPSFQKR